MDIERRKLAMGLMSLPVLSLLVGCDDANSSSEFGSSSLTMVTENLAKALNDADTAHILAPYVQDTIFDIDPPYASIDSCDNLIAFAFGNRPNASDNPNELAEPGPMNKELAECCAKLYAKKSMPMFVQWEIARFLSSDYPGIPQSDIISIEPSWNEQGTLIYLSTDGVAKEIIKTHFNGDPAQIGTAAVIGHRDHVKRCVMTCQGNKIESRTPMEAVLPVWYDIESDQPWTRRRDLYVLLDMANRLGMVAQANITAAFP